MIEPSTPDPSTPDPRTPDPRTPDPRTPDPLTQDRPNPGQPAESRLSENRTGFCFGCGQANPQGLHLCFAVAIAADGGVTASTTTQLNRMHEGGGGFAHGGIVATLLDEAMSKLNKPLGGVAVTRHLAVDYLRPVPLGTTLTLSARHLRREGTALFHTAQLLAPDGRVLAQAEGSFRMIDSATRAQQES